MTGNLLSAVAGRTWATDTLCVSGVLCVCVLVGCAVGIPLLRLVLANIRRTHLAVFLAFALVATLCAQKQGTNSPPRGVVVQRSARAKYVLRQGGK